MFLGQGFLEVMVECLIVDGPSKPKLGSAPKGACLLAHPYLRDMGRCQIENNTPMFCGFPFGFPSKGYPFKTTPKDVASTKAHTHTHLSQEAMGIEWSAHNLDPFELSRDILR